MNVVKSEIINEYFVFSSQDEFYAWMENNHTKYKEIFVATKRGNPNNIKGVISYLDMVEVALCFGWIDSTNRSIDGYSVSRLSKRSKNTVWTELNKERCRRLIKLNLMTKYGLEVCPNLNEEFIEPKDVVDELKKDDKAYQFFRSTPKLYQRIRLYNVKFYEKINKKQYESALKNLIEKCRKNKLYGEWNDYGRLL